MKYLRKAIDDGHVLLDVDANSWEGVFEKAIDHLVEYGVVSAEDRDSVIKALMLREEQLSTAIGQSVAVPHVYLDSIHEQTIVFLRLAHPLNLGAPDGVPTRFFFLLLGPSGQASEHLDVLINVAKLMSDEDFRYDALQAKNSADLMQAIQDFKARAEPPPEAEPSEIPEELQYSGKFGGGFWRDIQRRVQCYGDDFRQGFSTKTISSTLFLLFACLAPAVTFGLFMDLDTRAPGDDFGQIGVVEMLVATAICGVLYALFSGQPLIILGGTGPLLIFTALLFGLCRTLSTQLGTPIPFLPTYAWVGIWTMGFLILLAFTDASCLMRFFTRFTDETFAALISIIFIYEALHKVYEVLRKGYIGHPEVKHDAALLTLILALGTYYIAMNLSSFRRSKYLHHYVREFLADFGPTIALTAMTIVAIILHEVSLERLPVPDALSPTDRSRSWVINLFDPKLPSWVPWAAAIPALLGTILIYLDQNITARIVNNPEHNLKKPGAYHLDLAVVGGLVGLCSCLGLPWLVAATVRSLNHVRSLATTEEVISPSGEAREQVIHVQETRVTGLAIHVIIGILCLTALPLLQQIPMAVLFGLFLYMGVVSMRGNQFFERLSLWAMDTALYPSTHYLRKVPKWVVHKFTLIQLVCLIVLWVVKTRKEDIGILFPLFIALLVPVRFAMNMYFNPEHLAALDAETEPEEEETQWH